MHTLDSYRAAGGDSPDDTDGRVMLKFKKRKIKNKKSKSFARNYGLGSSESSPDKRLEDVQPRKAASPSVLALGPKQLELQTAMRHARRAVNDCDAELKVHEHRFKSRQESL